MIPQSIGYISQQQLQYYSTLIVGCAAIYTLFSGFDYLYANRFYIKKLLTKKSKEAKG